MFGVCVCFDSLKFHNIHSEFVSSAIWCKGKLRRYHALLGFVAPINVDVSLSNIKMLCPQFLYDISHLKLLFVCAGRLLSMPLIWLECKWISRGSPSLTLRLTLRGFRRRKHSLQPCRQQVWSQSFQNVNVHDFELRIVGLCVISSVYNARCAR